MRLCVLLFLIVCISGCNNNTKRSLGIIAVPPDEFSVLSSHPLMLPEAFNLPEPGTQKTSKNSNDSVLDLMNHSISLTSSDINFLQKADIHDDKIITNIRSLIDKDLLFNDEENHGLIQQIVNKSAQYISAQKLVEPVSEKLRLDNNIKSGNNITEGEVPTYTLKQSVLGDIF